MRMGAVKKILNRSTSEFEWSNRRPLRSTPRGLSTQSEIDQLLTDKGLTEVRTLPGPPRDFKIIVAARRAQNS
jgi:hypothetical protein